jgi:DNA-binding protein HU-beta
LSRWPRPESPGAAFFIGFFQRITSARDREAKLRNKRLREIRGKIRHFLHCDGAILRRLLCRMSKKPVFLGVFSHIVRFPESYGAIMATQLSKSQLIEKISTSTELAKRDVKNVMDCLVDVGHKELKKSGIFLVPGFAKFVVVKKPATKARKGTNPFTGEEMMFKAKPARKIVRARPVKAAKDAVA